MKTLKKYVSLLLAVAMLLTVAGSFAEAAYERGDDDEIYDAVLGDFTALMEAAEAAESIDERFILECLPDQPHRLSYHPLCQLGKR